MPRTSAQEQEPQPTAYLYEVSVGGKSGFINQQGELVIPAQYGSARAFHQGLASVRADGKYGFIDREGELVIPTIYPRRVGHFSHGRAFVELGPNKLGYVKPDGEFAFVLDNVDISGPSHFAEGLVRVETAEGEMRFYDSDG